MSKTSAWPATGTGSLVTLSAGASRQIYADRATVQARFPLDLAAGVTIKQLQVTVVDVNANAHSANAAQGSFGASLVKPSASGQPAKLVVTVKLSSAVKPDTYNLVVRFRLRKKPRRKDPQVQKLAISVVVPAAQLRAPGTLTAERTMACFIRILCGTHDDKPKLDLVETSGASRLSNVRISDVGQATQDDRPTTARLEFTPPKEPIPPNGVGSGSYSIEGKLKPGTAKGALRIEANELQSGVEATWNLRVRRSGWDLLVVALAGLVFGFVTRIALQRLIDQGRARAAAGRLRRRLQAEQRQRPDPAFQESVATVESTLAHDSGFFKKPSEIAAAVNRASQSLTDALSALEQRRADATLEQERLDRLLSARYALPQEIQDARQSAKGAFDAAQNELDNERFSTALEKQGQARATLVQNVASAGAAWSGTVEEVLTELGTVTIPAELVPALNVAIQRTRAGLAAAAAVDTSDPKRAELGEIFRAYEEAFHGIWDVKLVLSQVDRTVKEVRAAIGSRPDFVSVDAAYVRLNQVLRDDAQLAEVGSAFSDLMTALAAAIRAAAPEPNAVDDLLAAGRYADAARTATSEEETALATGGEAKPEAEEAVLFSLPASALARDGVVTGARPVPGLTSVFENPVVVEVLGFLQYFIGRLIQWVLLSIVFLFLAWAIFSDDFIGTSSDLAKVFLWAFALDLSGNTLLDSAKALRSS